MRLCVRLELAALVVAAASCVLQAQVIEFESGGLKFQALSRNGVTLMWAHLPMKLHEYSILQVAVSNGSQRTDSVRPEDFTFLRTDGAVLRATPAKTVVDRLLDHATRSDVIKLISTYENTLNGMPQFRSTNGYEQRRQAALAEFGSSRLKAAAAASAIAFVRTRLDPGDSTDGAVFFATAGKPLGPGHLVVHTAGEIFEFDSEPQGSGKVLLNRTKDQP